MEPIASNLIQISQGNLSASNHQFDCLKQANWLYSLLNLFYSYLICNRTTQFNKSPMYYYLTTFLVLVLSSIGVYGQVQFKIEKMQDGETFQVSLIPDQDWGAPMNITSTAQVTIKVPTNSFEVKDLESLQADVNWEYNSKSTSPAEAPEYDYLSFGLTSMGTKKINYKKGVAVPLFTFKNADSCQGSVELMSNNDPFKSPNSKRANVGNSITVFGAKGEAYKGNFTKQAIPCQTALNLQNTTKSTINTDPKVYPNPAINEVFIDLVWEQATTAGDFVILDMNGKEVNRSTVEVHRGWNKVDLDVKDLPSGIFSIEFRNGEESLILDRFVKQHR